MDALETVLNRLLNLHPKYIDLSLERIQRLLEALDKPHHKLPPIVHVAGTNGKGSTIAFMRAILEANGWRVHVYTSPHLVRFNERIRLAGKLVEDRELINALEYCEKRNQGQPITFFEITTVAAFLLFHQNPADILLLEVGLGGRLDTTNVIAAPIASVITPISMDHPEFLGDHIGAIAAEKAGIIKKNIPVFSGAQPLEAQRVLEKTSLLNHASLKMYRRDFNAYEENGRFIFEDQQGLIDLSLPRLPGRHQIDNAALAIATLRGVLPELHSKIDDQALSKAYWPARLQSLSRGPLFDLLPAGSELWLDGAHNAKGGEVLAATMAEFEERHPQPLVLICGMLTLKDTMKFLTPFKDLVQEVIAVPVPGEHPSKTSEAIVTIAEQVGLSAVAALDFKSACRYLAARQWIVPPRVLIAGSLYLAGHVLSANNQSVL